VVAQAPGESLEGAERRAEGVAVAVRESPQRGRELSRRDVLGLADALTRLGGDTQVRDALVGVVLVPFQQARVGEAGD